MVKTDLALSVNEMQKRNQRAGFHWFDADTMRAFKCRISDTVHAGPGGIYFVSSEKNGDRPRRYTVRQWVEPNVESASEFEAYASATAAQNAAKRLAKTPITKLIEQLPSEEHDKAQRGYGRVVELQKALDEGQFVETKVKIVEAHIARTPMEDLQMKLEKEGCRTTHAADTLITLARKHNAECVNRCNMDRPDRTIDRIENNIRNFLTDYCGDIRPHFQRDPRGCTVKLILPSGDTNDFGKDGWIVPLTHGNASDD